MQKEAASPTDASLERRLVELAWTDPAFAELLASDPRRALESIGVQVPAGVKIDVRQQRRDTLYFLIPPPATQPEDAEKVVEQMDLWQSGDLFCWVMPQTHKLDLLAMQQSFRRGNS